MATAVAARSIFRTATVRAAAGVRAETRRAAAAAAQARRRSSSRTGAAVLCLRRAGSRAAAAGARVPPCSACVPHGPVGTVRLADAVVCMLASAITSRQQAWLRGQSGAVVQMLGGAAPAQPRGAYPRRNVWAAAARRGAWCAAGVLCHLPRLCCRLRPAPSEPARSAHCCSSTPPPVVSREHVPRPRVCFVFVFPRRN